MPIWGEVLFLALVAYVTGVTVGWLAWGRRNDSPTEPDADHI